MIYITIFHGNDELPAWVKVGKSPSKDAVKRAKTLYGLNGSLFWQSEPSTEVPRLAGRGDKKLNLEEKLLLWCAGKEAMPMSLQIEKGSHRYFKGFTETFGSFKNKRQAEIVAGKILKRYKRERKRLAIF
jgi:hypothetical protein